MIRNRTAINKKKIMSFLKCIQKIPELMDGYI